MCGGERGTWVKLLACVCVCVCMRARACLCVCAGVRVCDGGGDVCVSLLVCVVSVLEWNALILKKPKKTPTNRRRNLPNALKPRVMPLVDLSGLALTRTSSLFRHFTDAWVLTC